MGRWDAKEFGKRKSLSANENKDLKELDPEKQLKKN